MIMPWEASVAFTYYLNDSIAGCLFIRLVIVLSMFVWYADHLVTLFQPKYAINKEVSQSNTALSPCKVL